MLSGEGCHQYCIRVVSNWLLPVLFVMCKGGDCKSCGAVLCVARQGRLACDCCRSVCSEVSWLQSLGCSMLCDGGLDMPAWEGCRGVVGPEKPNLLSQMYHQPFLMLASSFDLADRSFVCGICCVRAMRCVECGAVLCCVFGLCAGCNLRGKWWDAVMQPAQSVTSLTVLHTHCSIQPSQLEPAVDGHHTN